MVVKMEVETFTRVKVEGSFFRVCRNFEWNIGKRRKGSSE